MPNFDLTWKPWIFCQPFGGGSPRELGLRDALVNAHEIQEIYDNSPLVTAALYRLLLAVLYSCRIIASRDDWDAQWQQLWLARHFTVATIDSYIDQQRERFDLFGEKHPFFQTAYLTMDRTRSVSRLATEAASGNNATLFDHTQDAVAREYSPAEAARLLVAAQSFALGFGKSSKARIGSLPVDPPDSTDAVLARGMTVWIGGATLFETLMLNLFPYVPSEDDRPAWERDAPYSLAYTEQGLPRKDGKVLGIVDQYTWQSRLIRLLPDEENEVVTVSRLYFTQGRGLDKEARDPMKAYRRDKTQGYVPIALSPSKAAWRDAHSLFAVPQSGEHVRRPEAFNFVARQVSDGILEQRYQSLIQVVGLATAPNKAAKLLLWRHDRMPVPARLLQDADLVESVINLTQEAEDIANALYQRITEICKRFLAPEGDADSARSPHPEDVARLAKNIDPRRAYWPRLEPHFYTLLRLLPDDETMAVEQWRHSVECEADEAFAEAHRELGSSVRALRAIAPFSERFVIWRSGDRPTQQGEETA